MVSFSCSGYWLSRSGFRPGQSNRDHARAHFYAGLAVARPMWKLDDAMERAARHLGVETGTAVLGALAAAHARDDERALHAFDGDVAAFDAGDGYLDDDLSALLEDV